MREKRASDSRDSKHHFLAVSETEAFTKKVGHLDVLYTEGEIPVLAGFVFRAACGADE